MIFDLTGTLLLILSHNLSIFGVLIPYFGIFLNLKPSGKSSRNKTKLVEIRKIHPIAKKWIGAYSNRYGIYCLIQRNEINCE